MDFVEFLTNYLDINEPHFDQVKKAWDIQQLKIDELEKEILDLKRKINENS